MTQTPSGPQDAFETLSRMLDGLSPSARLEAAKAALTATRMNAWVPNPGPQTQAFKCEADELFYGGQAGGGKTDLVAGLAIQQHQRSLILRRFNDDARDLAERTLSIIGDRNGYNGQLLQYRWNQKFIEWGGCKEEKDKQRYKGRPHDLICFDEITDFLESQYVFIIAWNRSADPAQRCRVVATGNPPTEAEGLWVTTRWGAWLDPTHPNPAEDGELRYYTTNENDEDEEVPDAGPHLVKGEEVYARSRTFIRARLSDNPDLTQSNDYQASLDALPAALRHAYRDGRFEMSMKDKDKQVIPTHWVIEAQRRWTERPPANVPMCAMGADVAQGGADKNVIATRYDGWFAPLIVVPGSETPLGSDIGGMLVARRRDNAVVVVDCGGGYGGGAVKTLKENDIEVVPYKGAEGSIARTADRAQLGFSNMRTEVWWRFREALDPSQEWGSPISLPPDPELISDLTSVCYKETPRGLKLEDPDLVKKRIGRSPDKGVAVVLCWMKGQRAITHHYMGGPGEMGLKTRNRRFQVITGRHHRPRR